MKLFGQAIFRGLARFVKSSVRVYIGLMGQLVFFPLCTFDIQVKCFTVPSILLRLNSTIHRNILQIFCCQYMGIFQEADRLGKIRPEWVYSFQTTLRGKSKFIYAGFVSV